ncbi:MAG: efflux RND transporter permease subunit [Acidobacteriota bacterium]
MSRLQAILSQRKLILTLSITLSLLGLLSWLTMARQEDPSMPDFWGQVVVQFPGADAETVERLVLTPTEEELASVDQVLKLRGSAYSEVAVITIDLREDVPLPLIPDAWDDIRQALEDAQREYPEGAGEPVLDDSLQDQESIVLALSGAPDPLVLAETGEWLKRRLLSLSAVSQVLMVADPEEAVYIEMADATLRRLGLEAQAVAGQLAARNQILPGGSVELDGRTVTLRPRTEFLSLEEIEATALMLPSGQTVPLGAVAKVRRGPQEPVQSVMRYNGKPAVGLGLVLRREGNVLDFGKEVRAALDEARPELEARGITLDTVIFQPDRVEERLDDLGRSLMMGIVIVAGVLIFAMGLRLGLIAASVVPLVTFSALALYAIGGGVLHQISIAALVIALGMLVDNAIVMAETIQWRLERGEEPSQAAVGAVRELAVPLAAATATTLAAFVPMFLSQGTTAEFTRAIPVLIMLTLSVSFLYAVFFTPTLSALLLRPRRKGAEDSESKESRRRLERFGRGLGSFAIRRPAVVLFLALAVVGTSISLAPLLDQQFFPSSDRNQLLFDLELPEGSHLEATDALAQRFERALLERPEVTAVGTFTGRSAPHFYYNLATIPWSPHLAQIIVDTTNTDTVDDVLEWARNYAQEEMAEAEIVGHKLEQGPAVEAPVEVRFYSESLEDLQEAAEWGLAELRRTDGAVDVRQSLGTGAPMMRFTVDDAAAARRGIDRSHVAAALFGRTRGLPVGELRSGDDPVPVVLRSAAGERYPVSDLEMLDVAAPGQNPVPLAQIATVELDWQPAAIHHFNGRRVARVLSQLEGKSTYSQVYSAYLPKLESVELPAGVTWEVGGAAESSGDANSAILRLMPVGALLLFGILMAEFRSFRRVGLVLATVPLAACGVIPGLLIGGQPFGFMSALGVLALIGVVVNNAIVLLEVIEGRRAEGASIEEALVDGVERRLRPILLTTATTVAGLTPLAVSKSTLWPPMAWAMISGLLASTFLTLAVIPALYRLFFQPPSGPLGSLLQRLRPGHGSVAASDLSSGAVTASSSAVTRSWLIPFLLLALTLGSFGFGGSPLSAQEPVQEQAQQPAQAQTQARDQDQESATEAQPQEVTLTLEQVLANAQRSPLPQAAEAEAEAARAVAEAERRGRRLPTVEADVSALRRDQDFEIETPIGRFPFGDSASEDAQVRVRQPLWDPVARYSAPAADARAEAAGASATRSRQLAAASAGRIFLQVLRFDAQLEATDAFIASLGTSLEETEARVNAGRALAVDALRVQLALEQAKQDRLALTQGRGVATRALGRALGANAAIEPRWEGSRLPAQESVPTLEPALDRALDQRSELSALESQTTALDLEREVLRAEARPRLDAGANWTWSSGAPYEENQWLEATVGVSWRPFAAGTRKPRAAALASQRSARQLQLEDARRQIEVEVRSALADLAIARGDLAVGRTGVEQATESLRVERERYDAGRSTTFDLLDAEAALRDKRTQRAVARLDLLTAWLDLQAALGDNSDSWLRGLVERPES